MAKTESEHKGSSITLHAHGDGTYHTISHGEHDYSMPMRDGKDPRRTEHPSFGHAVMHMAKHHAAGDHMHIEGHDDGFTTHHMMEDERRIRGPHEHATEAKLAKHVKTVMGGDEDGEGEDL